MKTKLVFFYWLLFVPILSVAQNLVPNPSFETYSSCPQFIGQINLATGWSSYKGSPDYFNTCANGITPQFGIPLNARGNQQALDGNAYAGIITYHSALPEAREFIGIELQQPLFVNQKYFVSFFVSLADTFGFRCETNKIGVKFSTISFSDTTPPNLTNSAQVFAPNIISNKTDWTPVTGSFIADSMYQYLTIGNFFDDLHTDSSNCIVYSFFYVDKICVSTDSLLCGILSDVKEIPNENSISISPNPTNGLIKLNGIKNGDQIKIYNTLGSLVLTTNYTNNLLDVKSLTKGIYLLKITGKRSSTTLKLIRQE